MKGNWKGGRSEIAGKRWNKIRGRAGRRTGLLKWEMEKLSFLEEKKIMEEK